MMAKDLVFKIVYPYPLSMTFQFIMIETYFKEMSADSSLLSFFFLVFIRPSMKSKMIRCFVLHPNRLKYINTMAEYA